MKKFSKRLTMVVAILLCLVLITSSAVSTTLAKYVITKDATTSVGLEKFGVTVTLTGPTTSTTSTSSIGDSTTIVYKSTSLTPGATAKKITASISGKPTVEAKITIDVSVSYSQSSGTAFSIPADTFTGISGGTLYVPIGFKVAGASSYTVSPYNNYTAAETEAEIEKAIVAKKSTLFTRSSNKVTGIFPANTEIGLTDLNIVMDWPKAYGSGEQQELNDCIGTYIASKSPSVVIQYVITVEQNV